VKARFEVAPRQCLEEMNTNTKNGLGVPQRQPEKGRKRTRQEDMPIDEEASPSEGTNDLQITPS